MQNLTLCGCRCFFATVSSTITIFCCSLNLFRSRTGQPGCHKCIGGGPANHRSRSSPYPSSPPQTEEEEGARKQSLQQRSQKKQHVPGYGPRHVRYRPQPIHRKQHSQHGTRYVKRFLCGHYAVKDGYIFIIRVVCV